MSNIKIPTYSKILKDLKNKIDNDYPNGNWKTIVNKTGPFYIQSNDTKFNIYSSNKKWDGKYPVSITYKPYNETNPKWVLFLVPQDQMWKEITTTPTGGNENEARTGILYDSIDIFRLQNNNKPHYIVSQTYSFQITLLALLNAGYLVTIITSDKNDQFNYSEPISTTTDYTGYWTNKIKDNITLQLLINTKQFIEKDNINFPKKKNGKDYSNTTNEIVYAGSSSGGHMVSRLIDYTPQSKNNLPKIKYGFIQSAGSHLCFNYWAYTWGNNIYKEFNNKINSLRRNNGYTPEQKKLAIDTYCACPGQSETNEYWGDGYCPINTTGMYYKIGSGNENKHPPVLLSQSTVDTVDNTYNRSTFAKLYFNGLSTSVKKKSQLLEPNETEFIIPDILTNTTNTNIKNHVYNFSENSSYTPPGTHGWHWPSMVYFINWINDYYNIENKTPGSTTTTPGSTTKTPGSTTKTPGSTTTSPGSTTTTPQKTQQSNNSIYIILLIVGIILLFILIGVSILYFSKKKK
jgi:hypothetical protein